MVNNVICPAPWNFVNVAPEGCAPCCTYENPNVVSLDRVSTPIDVLYSNEFEQIRKDMLAEKHNINCRTCYTLEKNNQTSLRKNLINEYNTNQISLNGLELIFDNVCNLKCRGCNSAGSHLWVKEERELFNQTLSPSKYINLKFNNYDVESLKQVNISGGEPLLSKQVKDFLKLLNQSSISNINLNIVTNATIAPSDTFLEAFKKCKQLDIVISIDGYNEINDYYRTNSKFSDIEKNLKFFYNYFNTKKDNFSLEITTTVNTYNVNMLNELEEFLKDYPLVLWTLKVLEVPQYLSIKHLPIDYKNKVLPYIEKYQYLVDEMYSSNEDYFAHFINFHQYLENRNQILPNKLLKEYIDSYNIKIDSTEFFDLQMRILRNELPREL